MNYMILPGLAKETVIGLSDKEREIECKKALESVCELYDITTEKVLENNKSRKIPFTEIRQISMFIFEQKLKCTLTQSADFFKKDHATAIFARKTVQNRYRFDKAFRTKTETLLQSLIN